MTMNVMDKDEIIKNIGDQLRVRVEHRSVELSSADIEEFQNFLEGLLSKYVDNKHINDKGSE